jgi:L-methionine (R)-S-oxide reductase
MEGIVEEIRTIVEAGGDPADALTRTCRVLKEKVPHYHWVGYYVVDPKEEGMLVLGPYVGAPTEHVRIPFGRGICGQAAARRETFVIQDVSREENYLSCSIDVRSEIVVPILDHGEILGELDIDSHAIAPFTQEDRDSLERICGLVVPLIREIRGSAAGNLWFKY